MCHMLMITIYFMKLAFDSLVFHVFTVKDKRFLFETRLDSLKTVLLLRCLPAMLCIERSLHGWKKLFHSVSAALLEVFFRK